MRSRVFYTNNVKLDPVMTQKRLYLPEVTRGSVPTESSRENTRILSDRVLWRSFGIHRTVVTYVTLRSISSLLTDRGGALSTEYVPSRMRSRVFYTNIVNFDPVMTRKSLYLPEVRRGSFSNFFLRAGCKKAKSSNFYYYHIIHLDKVAGSSVIY